MVFFSCAIIPLSQLPGWMQNIGRFTPISQGVVGLRAVMIDGQTSFPLGRDGGIVWMVAITAAYLVIGHRRVRPGRGRARPPGSLGRY